MNLNPMHSPDLDRSLTTGTGTTTGSWAQSTHSVIWRTNTGTPSHRMVGERIPWRPTLIACAAVALTQRGRHAPNVVERFERADGEAVQRGVRRERERALREVALVAEPRLDGTALVEEHHGILDFYGLREYEPGDDVRNVHWLSSAKTGTLMIRQFEATRRTDTSLSLGVNPDDYVDAVEFPWCASTAGSRASGCRNARVRRPSAGRRVRSRSAGGDTPHDHPRKQHHDRFRSTRTAPARVPATRASGPQARTARAHRLHASTRARRASTSLRRCFRGGACSPRGARCTRRSRRRCARIARACASRASRWWRRSSRKCPHPRNPPHSDTPHDHPRKQHHDRFRSTRASTGTARALTSSGIT